MTMGGECIVCGAPATRLCDFLIGGQLGGHASYRGKEYPVYDLDGPSFTCDAPLCDAHARRVGVRFVCGKDGQHDVIEHCPIHDGAEADCRPMTFEEAEAIRRHAHAQLRRMRMVLIN